MSRTSAIEIVEKPFTGIVFCEDMLTDNFCNWILEEMYAGGEMKTYTANFLCDRFNIPADQVNVVADVLKEKEFIQTSVDAKNELQFHLTWQGKAYMKEKLENAGETFSPLYTAHKRKPANFYLIAGVVIVVAIIVWLAITKFF